MIFIRWWNLLRNRPYITHLERQVRTLEQILTMADELDEQVEAELQRSTGLGWPE